MVFIIFNVICKTSVSEADQEIPTLGSRDNGGNSVNLVSRLSVYPQVGISLSASETDVKFYLSCVPALEQVVSGCQ